VYLPEVVLQWLPAGLDSVCVDVVGSDECLRVVDVLVNVPLVQSDGG